MDTPVLLILQSRPYSQQLTNTFHTEIPGEEEEHRQLPPHENVPQGCRSSQEGRYSGLKYSLHDIVHRDLAAAASCPLEFWVHFFIQYFARFLALIAESVRLSAPEAMGVGFYSMYSIQLSGIWNHLSNQLIVLLFQTHHITCFRRGLSNPCEIEDQFVALGFYSIGIDCFDLVVVDNGGAEIGVNRSHGQFHFC
jgi:hypothetical protein